MKVIIKTLLTLVIVLQALPATAADSSKTRKLFAVGSVGDDIAKFFGKIHWDILFTEDLKRAWMTKAVGLLHPFSLH